MITNGALVGRARVRWVAMAVVLAATALAGATGASGTDGTGAPTASTVPTSATTATTAAPTSGTTVPGGSAPSPTAAPKLPVPAPFPFPLDFGNRAVADRDRAQRSLTSARAQAERLGDRARGLRRRLATLERRRAALGAAYEDAARRLEQTELRINEMLAALYRGGAASDALSTIEALRSSDDVVAAQRGLTLLQRSKESQDALLGEYRRMRAQAADRVAEVVDSLAYVRSAITRTDQQFADARARRLAWAVRLQVARRDLRDFFAAATTSASPVMGPSRLTARELAAFVRANHRITNLTVPLDALARFFVEEGRDEGVRGDVAFAQALLETGWFGLGKRGLVTSDDNNFAGIGACDTCDRGFTFDSARIGVRAQMQLLRIYADPELTSYRGLHHPMVYSRLHAPLGGRNPTWYSLEGRWATARNYGIHVYDLYMRIVEFALQARRSGR